MSMPTQIEIEIPLLLAIKKLGGKVKLKDIYPLVTQQFTQLTESDLEQQMANGGNKWIKGIRWTRQN